MGLGGINLWQLIIILLIVLLLFGSKKLRNIGGDLGNAVKGFKKAMKEEQEEIQHISQEKTTASKPAEQVQKQTEQVSK